MDRARNAPPNCLFTENGLSATSPRPSSGLPKHSRKGMRRLRRFAQGELWLNRIEAFSDGVFATIVTLLVLELRVPVLHDRGSANELDRQLVDLLPSF